MPKSKNIPIKYTSRDFESIKKDLIEHAKRYYPDDYNDFSESIFLQPLFEWTPNPFTIFYIGGNQNLIKEKEYYVDRSQFFVKFQYLISL